eukprot:gene32610-873_t
MTPLATILMPVDALAAELAASPPDAMLTDPGAAGRTRAVLSGRVSAALRHGSSCASSVIGDGAATCGFGEAVVGRGMVSTLFAGSAATCTHCRHENGILVLVHPAGGIEIDVAISPDMAGARQLAIAVSALGPQLFPAPVDGSILLGSVVHVQMAESGNAIQVPPSNVTIGLRLPIPATYGWPCDVVVRSYDDDVGAWGEGSPVSLPAAHAARVRAGQRELGEEGAMVRDRWCGDARQVDSSAYRGDGFVVEVQQARLAPTAIFLAG